MPKLILSNPNVKNKSKEDFSKFLSSGSVDEYRSHLDDAYRTMKQIAGEPASQVHTRIKVSTKRAILDKAADHGIQVTSDHHTHIDKMISSAMAQRNKKQKGLKSRFGVTESK